MQDSNPLPLADNKNQFDSTRLDKPCSFNMVIVIWINTVTNSQKVSRASNFIQIGFYTVFIQHAKYSLLRDSNPLPVADNKTVLNQHGYSDLDEHGYNNLDQHG